jgi:nitrogen fixation NifU-like protein
MPPLIFDDVRDLYSAEIRQHGRTPMHAQRPDGFDAQARGDNPMCGDRVTVFVRRSGDAVDAAGFEARGCEITVASADLMCEAVAGRSRADVGRMAAEVEAMARTGLCEECEAALQALKPLSAVHEYPSRIRCVTLPWAALVAALDGAQEATSE